MDQQTVSQLRLEPGGLGRHDLTRVRDPDQVLDLYREEREGDRRPAFVDGLLELAGASPAADEVDPGVGANVADSEKRLEDLLLEQRDVERRRRARARAEGETEAVPPAGQVDGDLSALGRRGRRVLGNRPDFLQSGQEV